MQYPPALSFEFKHAAIPYDPGLCANCYAEYRQGCIRIYTGLPVRSEDRAFKVVIPTKAFATH
mgnify:FL=1